MGKQKVSKVQGTASHDLLEVRLQNCQVIVEYKNKLVKSQALGVGHPLQSVFLQ